MAVYTPEPQTTQDAPWLRGPSLKKHNKRFRRDHHFTREPGASRGTHAAWYGLEPRAIELAGFRSKSRKLACLAFNTFAFAQNHFILYGSRCMYSG
jgi:hypothetical protein